jgi:hypothetical protein
MLMQGTHNGYTACQERLPNNIEKENQKQETKQRIEVKSARAIARTVGVHLKKRNDGSQQQNSERH